MLAITVESGRIVWPAEACAEAIGEMARLTLSLTDKIVADRTAGRTIANIDPAEEERILGEPHSIQKIENMAQNLAKGVWFKVYDELYRKRRSLDPQMPANWPPKLPGRTPRRRQKGTTTNHYVPQFTTKPWADSQGQVWIVKRDDRRVITARRSAHRAFGYEKLLYPQHLEDWFSLIENCAKTPYQKLVAVDVLTPEDRYFWISFLVTQYLRTPSYMAAIAKGLRKRAMIENWPWSTTPDLLRRAYETTFANDKVFAAYYRRFDRLRWNVITASSEGAFPRTDSPVVLTARGGWRCYYPLTPTKCFVAGPDLAEDSDVPAALSITIAPEATTALTDAFIQSSRRSFVVRASEDQTVWIKRAQHLLPATDPAESCMAWGGIVVP